MNSQTNQFIHQYDDGSMDSTFSTDSMVSDVPAFSMLSRPENLSSESSSEDDQEEFPGPNIPHKNNATISEMRIMSMNIDGDSDLDKILAETKKRDVHVTMV